MRTHLFSLFLALSLTAPAGFVFAQTGDLKADAQAKMNQGKALFDEGKSAEALRAFEDAYAMHRNPRWLYTIGVAYQTLGRDAEAMTSFDTFLAQTPDVSPAHRADVEAQRAALRGKLGQVDVRCAEAGALVSLDGRSQGQTPLPAFLWAGPGAHHVSVQKAGFDSYDTQVLVTPGQAATVQATLRPRTMELAVAPTTVAPGAELGLRSQAAAPETPVYKKWWFWAGIGAAVVAAGVVTAVAASGGGGRVACDPGYCE